MESIISLPITIQNDVITSFSKAYPLCILYNNNNFINWYTSKYIRSFGSIWKDGSSEFDVIDWCGLPNEYIKGAIKEWFQIKYYSPGIFSKYKDFFDFLGESILKEQYCVVFVDEFYISASKKYLVRHFMHEFLIYGLDYEKQRVLTVGFNKQKYLDKVEIPFSELYTGMINFKENSRLDIPVKNVQIIGLTVNKSFYFPQINIRELRKEIGGYITAGYSEDEMRLIRETYDGEIFMGMGTYELLQYHIINVKKNKENYDFRLIHFFYEHKMGIYNKMKMIGKTVSLHNVEKEYYAAVIDPIQEIRMHYLKDRVVHRNTFEESKLNLQLTTVERDETTILEKMYKLLLKNDG